MKEGFSEPNNENMSRRSFLKKLGIGALAVGVGATGVHELGEFLEKSSVENKEHEKEGEAVVTKKEILNSKGMPSMIDQEKIPFKGVDMCFVSVKINDKETILDVSYDEYKKYQVGDVVPVRYDDRDMRVDKILVKKEIKD